MAGPPTDLAPHELVRKLLEEAPGDTHTVRRVRADGSIQEIPIRVQVLRIEENHEAIAAAQEYAKRRGEQAGYADIYREAQSIEVLLRALRRTESRVRDSDGVTYYPRAFVTAEQLRASLTEPELALLLNAYELTKARYSPLETMSDYEIDEWISRLSEGYGGHLFLAQLDSAQWPELLLGISQRARELFQMSGQTLPDWRRTSASDLETSPDGTTSSSGEPSAVFSAAGDEVPGDALLTREAAAEAVRQRRKK